MKKRVLSILLAVILLMTCIPVASLTVSAASGYYIFDAIKISTNKTYAKAWSSYSDSEDCYNELKVSSRGYITFSISKPIDDFGNVSTFELKLYDSNAQMVWSTNTEAQKNNFSTNYTYKIGLKAGTYYMNIIPNFSVTSGTIASTYKYTHKATTSWEIEGNNSPETATTMSLNKTYTGVYLEESWDNNDYQDYWKIKLTKGKKYRLIIGNASALDVDTAILDFLDPYGESVDDYSNNGIISLGYGKISGKYRYFDFTTKYSGYHYVQLHNDNGEAGTEYTVKVNVESTPISKLKVSLSTTSYTYDGKAKKPSVVVKTAGGTKLSSSNYTVTYASGRKNVGKYKVTVKMKGSYSGSKTLYFTIKPSKTTVLKLTPAKTLIKAYVSKKSTQVSGYQIQYSTSKSFKSYKTKNLSSYKTTSTSLTGLKRKTTYYVRVRTYKTVNGTKIYSSWSTAKKTKTK